MNGLKILAYLGLVILSILFVLSTLVGTVVWSVNATVLKPYHSIDYLNKSGIYTGIRSMMDTMMDQVNDNSNNSTDGDNQDKNQQAIEQKIKEQQEAITDSLNTAIKNTLTDSYVGTKLSSLQSTLWDFLTDKGDLSVVIATPELQEAATQAINENEKLTDDVKAEVAKNIKENIPASFNLNTILNKSDSANSTSDKSNNIDFEQVKSVYKNIKLASLGVYATVVILLIGCILITLSLKNTRGWIGTILIIPGILVLALAFGVKTIPSQIKLNDLPAELSAGISQLFDVVIGEVSSQFIILSVILVVLSILVYVSKWILSFFRKPTESA